MPVTISCDPVGEFLRVVTCNEDGRQCLFAIDADSQVQHEPW